MMSKKFLAIIAIASLLALTATPFSASGASQNRKIVVFDETVNEPAREALINQFGGTIEKNLPLIDGAAVLLPPQADEALGQIPGVIRVDDDIKVFAVAGPPVTAGKTPPPQPPEELPWGVNRIDADLAWATSTGTGVKVAILDTGIDIDHPDLVANIKGGVNTINPSKSFNDDNGHGTHVAGIAAAVDNDIGVIGVAPQAHLYGIKVLNKAGWGWLSDIIEGLQWSIDNGMKVANMSFGSSSDNQSFHDAITAAYNAGITLVAAAGNSGPGDNTVNYPAKYSEVIAVSATNSSDGQPDWSSRGPEVDLAAPGASIKSTYKGDTYATLSGTSMAAPHVTGTAALVLAKNSALTPAEVTNILKTTAEKLSGLTDNQQGAGLVDAEKAVLY